MKKVILTVVIHLIFLKVNSQNPTFAWVNQLGGNSSYAYAKAITTDKFGNSYSTGAFTGTVDLDPSAGTFTLASSFGDYDVYIVKLNASGNFVWAKNFQRATNISTSIESTDIEVDDSGNVILLGTFDAPVDFDPSPTTFSITALGDTDIFVCKLDNSGNFVWVKQFASNSSFADLSCDQALAVDNFGNIAFAGTYEGTADFDPSAGVSTLTSNGNDDVFVCKINSLGNLMWAKSIGGAQSDDAETLGIDGSKNIVIGGTFKSQVDFDPNSGVTTYSSQGTEDAFVLKLDSLGNFVWVNAFGSAAQFGSDRASRLVVKNNGDVFISDFFGSTVDFDPSPATATLIPTSPIDTYILKFNANGSFSWVKQITGSGFMEPRGIDLDFLGNVYVTGYYNGLNDCDPGAGTYTINSSTNGYFIMKLDPNGIYSWARAIDGSSNDEVGVSVKIDPNGNIYSTGYFSTNGVDFDPDAGVTQLNLSGGGSYDVFIHKFNQCLAPFPPTNTTLSNFLTICSGDGTSLSASGTGSVNWYTTATSTSTLITNNNYSTPTLSTGTYTYYAEANTCTVSLNRTAITLTVNPNPTITIVSSNSTICEGESVTLTASGANSYTWILPIGVGPSIVISPTATTVFTVSGTNTFGCSNTTTATQIVDACVGIEERRLKNHALKIYPNPTNEIITIQSSVAIEEISISDITGKIIQVYKNEGTGLTCSINIQDLSSGIYLVSVKENSFNTKIKIVKN